MRKLLIGLIAIFLVGCTASSGDNFDTNNISSFKPGITTYQDAVNNIGKPHQIIDNGDSKAVQWLYVTSNGLTMETHIKNLIILFDNDNKMIRIKQAQGLE